MLGAADLPSCSLIKGSNTILPSLEYLIIASNPLPSLSMLGYKVCYSMIYAPFVRRIDIAPIVLFARVYTCTTALKLSS